VAISASGGKSIAPGLSGCATVMTGSPSSQNTRTSRPTNRSNARTTTPPVSVSPARRTISRAMVGTASAEAAKQAVAHACLRDFTQSLTTNAPSEGGSGGTELSCDHVVAGVRRANVSYQPGSSWALR
jgi:hypothetical protein